jgi:hypothetical protein
MSKNLEKLFEDEIVAVIKISTTLNFNIARTLNMIRFSSRLEFDSDRQQENLDYLHDIIRASVNSFYSCSNGNCPSRCFKN